MEDVAMASPSPVSVHVGFMIRGLSLFNQLGYPFAFAVDVSTGLRPPDRRARWSTYC